MLASALQVVKRISEERVIDVVVRVVVRGIEAEAARVEAVGVGVEQSARRHAERLAQVRHALR